KLFTDDAAETLVIMKYDPESGVSPLEQFNSKVKEVVTKVRKTEEASSTMDKIAFLAKIPRPVLRLVMRVLNSLDYRGRVPSSLADDDPYHVTAFVTNLGSIKMHASYHHLVNWGTNSLFCVINAKQKRPFFNDDGTYEMKDSIELGLTIDERIADGVYFAKSLRVFRHFFENPQLLDLPASTFIEIDTNLNK
ncbi:MAG: 2-oxo acid dehydrogenase subunit E2, partial [Eubacteriales bacterium]